MSQAVMACYELAVLNAEAQSVNEARFARFGSLPTWLVVLGVLPSLGASYRTDNFAVEAPSKQAARKVAEAAEQCRRQIIARWLGKENVSWSEVCSVDVELAPRGRSGASRFTYRNDEFQNAQISLRGPLNELLPRVLPHEVTHTVLTMHFGRPLPRWADEGAAILAEDSVRHDEYDRAVLRILERPNRAYSLNYLLKSKEYPGNLEVFYPQSYSLTRYLVELRGRRAFLAFLQYGLDNDWDSAVNAYYRFDDVNDLERSWRGHLKVVKARVVLRDAASNVAAEMPLLTAAWWARSKGTLEMIVPSLLPPPQPTREFLAMPR